MRSALEAEKDDIVENAAHGDAELTGDLRTFLLGRGASLPIPKEEPMKDELLEYKAQMDPWQLWEHTKSYAGLVPYCGKCLGICPVKQGKHPF